MEFIAGMKRCEGYFTQQSKDLGDSGFEPLAFSL